MKSLPLAAGVDVSKDTLDVFYNDQQGKEHYLKVANDSMGHKTLITKLDVNRTYVMETSGPYYLQLAFRLVYASADVRVENPLVVKRFILMQLERNKSDKKDARWLYRFAIEREPSIWHLPDHQQIQCIELLSAIDLFTRQLTQLHNQIHAFRHSPVICKSAIKVLSKTIAAIQKQVIVLEKELNQILLEWHGEQLKNITSIPGLGKRAAALLIVYTDGFKKITNHRQLIALTGLAPKEYSSGSTIRAKAKICKMGNKHLRNVLYMCAMSAIKYNDACKALFDRLKTNGKNGKVALIAVCNKLLKQAFAITKKGTTYQVGYRSSLS